MIELVRAEFGLHLPELTPLEGGRVNRLWRCGDWVVKLYDPGQVPVEQAQQAIHIQKRLGFPASEPLPTRSGKLWAESEAGMVVVMDYLSGHRRTRGTLSATEAAHLGSTLGNLHDRLRELPVAAPRLPDPDAIRQRWERLRAQAQSADDFDSIVQQTAAYVSAALGRMEPPDWSLLHWQFCHGDLHLDNILFAEDGRVTGVLDFDNAAPAWAEVELMMAWNLGFSADPRAPGNTSEADVFFRHYSQACGAPVDLDAALRAYWFSLISSTWPAAARYREGIVRPEWVEMLSMRYEAAKWIETYLSN